MNHELAIFASRFDVPASVAYVLPALFERTAAMAKLPVRAFLAQATYSNQALGEYLAKVAHKVAEEDRA